MIPTDRFLPLAMQRRKEFQPECPVYVHCSRRSMERESGTVLLQVRLFNCGEREIRTVFLNLCGRNPMAPAADASTLHAAGGGKRRMRLRFPQSAAA